MKQWLVLGAVLAAAWLMANVTSQAQPDKPVAPPVLKVEDKKAPEVKKADEKPAEKAEVKPEVKKETEAPKAEVKKVEEKAVEKKAEAVAAQPAPAAEAPKEKEKTVPEQISAAADEVKKFADEATKRADTAWMLVSTAFVMLMVPGLALFYGGMVRRKNVLATMMQSMICLSVVGVFWVGIGYSLAFGDPWLTYGDKGSFLGFSKELIFLNGVTPTTYLPGGTIPVYLHMAYQGMFAIITPALISGALAERIKFKPYLLFVLVWMVVVYCPLAQAVWAFDYNWTVNLASGTKGMDLEEKVGSAKKDWDKALDKASDEQKEIVKKLEGDGKKDLSSAEKKSIASLLEVKKPFDAATKSLDDWNADVKKRVDGVLKTQIAEAEAKYLKEVKEGNEKLLAEKKETTESLKKKVDEGVEKAREGAVAAFKENSGKAATGYLGKMDALDFAGGTVVHIAAGLSSLACFLALRKRFGYPEHAFHPNSMVLTLLGAGILWMGWFGFNGGSGLVSGTLAVSAFAATQAAAAGAGLTWTLVEWFHRGKPTALGFASGAVAGLVAVTPAAGFIVPWAGLAIGLIAGVVCYVSVFMKSIFKYDDSLDAFGVHGVGGFLGAILTGFFCWKPVNSAIANNGFFYETGDRFKQVGIQFVAAAGSAILAFAASFILVKVIDALMGFCVTEDEETTGLDRVEHGETGFDLGLALESASIPVTIEPKSAVKPPNGVKHYSVVIDGVGTDDLAKAWSDLCVPSSSTSADFKSIYPNLTTVKENRFKFRGGDPTASKDSLKRLLDGRLKKSVNAKIE